jgi:cell division septal protein FtsQ
MNAMLTEEVSVGRRILIVLTQNILFDLHHPRLTHPRRMGVCRPLTVIMSVLVGMLMFMIVMMLMIIDCCFTFSATADCAHGFIL